MSYVIQLLLLLSFFIKFDSTLAFLEIDGYTKVIFSKVEGKSLQGFDVSTVNVSDPEECTLECLQRLDQCKSFNYKPNSITGNKLCEIKSRTRFQEPGSYQNEAGSSHYFNYYYENFTSCLDIRRANITNSGLYKFRLPGTTLLPTIYCDFDQLNSAWALIMSFSFKNRNIKAYCQTPFYKNNPRYSVSPNWNDYRMSLEQMKAISKSSELVRFTTSINIYGFSYTDHLRAKISNFDILTYQGSGICKKIDLINTRGIQQRYTTVPFWQKDVANLHTDSSSRICNYDGTSGSTHSNDDFGRYCSNAYSIKFRGCENDASTTNYWFGGFM